VDLAQSCVVLILGRAHQDLGPIDVDKVVKALSGTAGEGNAVTLFGLSLYNPALFRKLVPRSAHPT
jgi:hypothetical protein